jgi:hypothetical protein
MKKTAHDDLIKNFLEDGTAKGFGDLSMMVSHITKAFSTGQKTKGKQISGELTEARFYLFGLIWALENKDVVDVEFYLSEAQKYRDKYIKKWSET